MCTVHLKNYQSYKLERETKSSTCISCVTCIVSRSINRASICMFSLSPLNKSLFHYEIKKSWSKLAQFSSVWPYTNDVLWCGFDCSLVLICSLAHWRGFFNSNYSVGNFVVTNDMSACLNNFPFWWYHRYIVLVQKRMTYQVAVEKYT